MDDMTPDTEVFVGDDYRNFIARVGTTQDKSAYGHHVARLLSDAELLASYRGSWLSRKIVDIIPDDATREWRRWNTGDKKITEIEDEEKRLRLKEVIRDAMRTARLYGFCAVHFAIDGDTPEGLAEELDPETVGRGAITHLTVIPKKNVVIEEISTDPLSPWFGRPEHYTIHRTNLQEEGRVKVHASRLMVFHGQDMPVGSTIGLVNYQGDSALQSILDAILKADAASSNIASLIFEAKIDVIGIPNLNKAVTNPRDEQALINRFTLASFAKNNNSTLLLDAAETYDRKQITFAGLPDLMDRFFQNVAGAADIPMTRLYGMSPAGLNATGESDLKNYYDRIRVMQELDIDPKMAVFNTALKCSAMGTNDTTIFHEWRPLWQMSEKERVEVGKGVSEIGKNLAGIVTPEAVSESVANALIEYSVLPGLEEAIDEFGAIPPEPTAAEMAAMGVGGPATQGTAKPKPKLRVVDEQPAPSGRMENLTPEQKRWWREYAEANGLDPDDLFPPDLTEDRFNPNQPRDDHGRWTSGAGAGGAKSTSGGRDYRPAEEAAYAAAARAAKASQGDAGLAVDIASGADAYFVAGNGMSAFAMRGNDFIGLASHKNNPEKGVAKEMVEVAAKYAKEKGFDHITLDCFEPLPKVYSKYGFNEVERVPFNWDYAPDGWEKRHGEPDVVFMRKEI